MIKQHFKMLQMHTFLLRNANWCFQHSSLNCSPSVSWCSHAKPVVTFCIRFKLFFVNLFYFSVASNTVCSLVNVWIIMLSPHTVTLAWCKLSGFPDHFISRTVDNCNAKVAMLLHCLWVTLHAMNFKCLKNISRVSRVGKTFEGHFKMFEKISPVSKAFQEFQEHLPACNVRNMIKHILSSFLHTVASVSRVSSTFQVFQELACQLQLVSEDTFRFKSDW